MTYTVPLNTHKIVIIATFYRRCKSRSSTDQQNNVTKI